MPTIKSELKGKRKRGVNRYTPWWAESEISEFSVVIHWQQQYVLTEIQQGPTMERFVCPSARLHTSRSRIRRIPGTSTSRPSLLDLGWQREKVGGGEKEDREKEERVQEHKIIRLWVSWGRLSLAAAVMNRSVQYRTCCLGHRCLHYCLLLSRWIEQSGSRRLELKWRFFWDGFCGCNRGGEVLIFLQVAGGDMRIWFISFQPDPINTDPVWYTHFSPLLHPIRF